MPTDHEETSLHDSLDAALNELESAPDTTPEPPSIDEPASEPVSEPVVEAVEADASNETNATNETDAPQDVTPDAQPEGEQVPQEAAPVDEVDALIKESGVRSVRGQERIRKVFEARKEAEAKAQEYEQDITQFKDMLRQTRMDEQQFATVLEYGRLANSDNPQDRMLALQLIDQQRALLAKELGVEVPGVDPLDDFPQLKAEVQAGMPREYALQLAKYQRQEQAQLQARQAQEAQQQQAQQFQQQLGQVQSTAEAYFKTREKEADYAAKMAQISAKFKDPAFIQEFVTNYEPRQWFGLLKMMYDQTQVVRPAAPAPRPISARPAHSGAPSTSGLSLKDSLSAAADQLGI